MSNAGIEEDRFVNAAGGLALTTSDTLQSGNRLLAAFSSNSLFQELPYKIKMVGFLMRFAPLLPS